MEERNKFWINEPSILYKNNNYLKFLPTFEMTTVEQFNAITLLCIYLIIIILILNMNKKWLLLPLLCILSFIIIFFIFYSSLNQQIEKINYPNIPRDNFIQLSKEESSKIINNDSDEIIANNDSDEIIANIDEGDLFKTIQKTSERNGFNRIFYKVPDINEQPDFVNWLYGSTLSTIQDKYSNKINK